MREKRGLRVFLEEKKGKETSLKENRGKDFFGKKGEGANSFLLEKSFYLQKMQNSGKGGGYF